MEYEFLNSSINKDNFLLPNTNKINPFLLKNNQAEIMKALDFIGSDEKFLYIHGFLGTGKRQFLNYICDFLAKNVIKLEYYCKQATVCDDILLSFIDKLENTSTTKNLNTSINAKITTLDSRFKQLIFETKKPILIILHSFDDILEENIELVKKAFSSSAKNENIKIIVSTRGLNQNVLGDLEENRKIFLKAFTKNIFSEFLDSNGITASKTTLEDFYKYTRGYYYYTALSTKIIQTTKTSLTDFLAQFNQADKSFDSFLGEEYLKLIPNTIRNFFWFLRTIRHGLTLNALAVFELYDDFSLEYLKQNLMIFQVDETIYVQDYFIQNLDISIPAKTEIKLHKYIIGLYEKQLKEPLQSRVITISRQALRAEIDYHSKKIATLQSINNENIEEQIEAQEQSLENNEPQEVIPKTIIEQIEIANNLASERKYTDAIEKFHSILELENITTQSVVEVRGYLAKLYKAIENYRMSAHFYELAEIYYKQHKEYINLNYLHYEMTDLYYKMYKSDRAIETIKKVIYSVDTPQSLLVSSCLLLGNIYFDNNNLDEAISYYQRAIESLDDNDEEKIIAELYFKYALAHDEQNDMDTAFNYYNKCLTVPNNPFKALAYSNMASCYYDRESYDDALACFKKSYKIEKDNNNYDGIYYTASHIAKIYLKEDIKKAYDYLIEAKKSAEFINEDFYILESTIALGDFYYNYSDKSKECLREYYKALNLAQNFINEIDINIIKARIEDMKHRMNEDEFVEIERKYAK